MAMMINEKYLINAPAAEIIDRVNEFTLDEAKRCRILLAALLYRLEATAGDHAKR